MRKKQEKGGYALASSSISDIPVPLTSGQGEYYISTESRGLKQSSSLFMPYNHESSRGEESVNLNFSTARPFYDEITEEYYSSNQTGQKQEYNIQSGRVSYQEKSVFRKSPNKRIMVYSYSNVFSLNKIIQNLIKQIKKRTFQSLSLPQETVHHSDQNSIQHYQRRVLEKEKVFLSQGRKKAVTIIEGWVCYQLLRQKRRVMNLIIYCSQQRRSSLSLSQSLRISQGAEENHFLTGFRSSNQISITQGLPQQIEESLVYALQNQEPSRKETTESTLEKYPTQREEHQTQKKGQYVVSVSSAKSSPVEKLKALSNSPTALDITIGIAQPLPLFKGNAPPVTPKRDSAIMQSKDKISEQYIKQEEGLAPDVFEYSKKEEEGQIQLGEVWEQVKKKRFQESSKYSQVSNYQLDKSKNKQETYIIKTTLANRPSFEEDRTVVKSHASPFLSTRVIRNEKIADSSQQISSIAAHRFGYQSYGSLHDINQQRRRQQPMNQLQNDRIRIFQPPCPVPTKTVVQAGHNFKINSNIQGNVVTFQRPLNMANHSPSPSSIKSIEPRVINGNRPILLPNQRAYPPNAQILHKNTNSPDIPFNQRMRTNASPNVYFHSPNKQRQLIKRPINNEVKIFTQSPNLVNRAISPQHQIQSSSSPFSKHLSQTHLVQNPQSTLHRISSPQCRSPVRVNQLKQPRRQVQQRIIHQRHQMLEQPNQYELQVREKRQLRIPERRALQVQVLANQDVQNYTLTSRAKSSASSPKLVFNYGSVQGDVSEQKFSSNLTKNNSQISRPKSMNSKLHITLKHKK